MAYVHKRKSDKDRGKLGKWTCYWTDENGQTKSRVGVTDRKESFRLAQQYEERARKIQIGEIDPEQEQRQKQLLRSITDHIQDYQRQLEGKGDDAKHIKHVTGVLQRLFENAGIASLVLLTPDRIQTALGNLRGNRSARTCNHALGATKAFVTWLYHANRIKEIPRGLGALKPFNEKEDRRHVRRALTKAEMDRLLVATEAAEPVKLSRRGYQYTERWLSGPERAALYRLAMGTGFRADELRTLTPERFTLDGDSPTITVLACYSKNGKEAIQPITRELAREFRPFLTGKELGRPVLDVPEKTAKLLRGDLARAGIAYKDEQGRVVDFHALRHSYVSYLVSSGANAKIVQTLARHSTIVLTMDRYAHAEDADLRKALEKGTGESMEQPPSP